MTAIVMAATLTACGSTSTTVQDIKAASTQPTIPLPSADALEEYAQKAAFRLEHSIDTITGITSIGEAEIFDPSNLMPHQFDESLYTTPAFVIPITLHDSRFDFGEGSPEDTWYAYFPERNGEWTDPISYLTCTMQVNYDSNQSNYLDKVASLEWVWTQVGEGVVQDIVPYQMPEATIPEPTEETKALMVDIAKHTTMLDTFISSGDVLVNETDNVLTYTNGEGSSPCTKTITYNDPVPFEPSDYGYAVYEDFNPCDEWSSPGGLPIYMADNAGYVVQVELTSEYSGDLAQWSGTSVKSLYFTENPELKKWECDMQHFDKRAKDIYLAKFVDGYVPPLNDQLAVVGFGELSDYFMWSHDATKKHLKEPGLYIERYDGPYKESLKDGEDGSNISSTPKGYVTQDQLE